MRLVLIVCFGVLAGTGCGESGSDDGGPTGGGSGGTSGSSGAATGGTATGGTATGGAATGGTAGNGSGGVTMVGGSGGSAMGGAGRAPVLGSCTIDEPDGCPSGYECACGGPGPGQCLCHKSCTEDADCGAPGMTCGCDASSNMPAICVDACFCLCN
ncbi:MAG TPA: hypothetical protein VF103_02935 [Polyangiaceae bacterium]